MPSGSGESRRAACALAERLWSENRATLAWRDGGIEHIEILDEYEEGGEA
jgi:hypothetical protein